MGALLSCSCALLYQLWCNSFSRVATCASEEPVRATRVLCAGVPSPVTLSCTLWPGGHPSLRVKNIAQREPTTRFHIEQLGRQQRIRTRTECCGIGRECRPRRPTNLVSERLGVVCRVEDADEESGFWKHRTWIVNERRSGNEKRLDQ